MILINRACQKNEFQHYKQQKNLSDWFQLPQKPNFQELIDMN